jgi:cathepsin D
MAGYAVEDQAFAVVNSVTPGLLSSPVSGVMGLAFRGLASSGATPFWSRVAASGLWDKPLMSFCLTRFASFHVIIGAH